MDRALPSGLLPPFETSRLAEPQPESRRLPPEMRARSPPRAAAVQNRQGCRTRAGPFPKRRLQVADGSPTAPRARDLSACSIATRTGKRPPVPPGERGQNEGMQKHTQSDRGAARPHTWARRGFPVEAPRSRAAPPSPITAASTAPLPAGQRGTQRHSAPWRSAGRTLTARTSIKTFTE